MRNKPDPNIAVIYARYSSQKQNDESIEQQVEVCEEYAAQHNLKIINTYADRATTGTDDKREQFRQMIQDAELGTFGTIIAYKSNRISRKMLQAMLYEEQLKRCGIRIVYAKEEYGDTVSGRFMLRSMMNLNQFYSENLGEDVKRGMTMGAKEGKAMSIPPFGYKIENGQFVVDTEQAKTVRRIFEMYSNGYAVSEIAEAVKGVRRTNGKLLGEHSVRDMLTKRMYIGEYSWNGIVYNNVEPIITKELFDSVQNRRSSSMMHPQKHIVSENYYLTGKLFCADCGSYFTGYSGTSHTGKRFNYYRCKNKECPHRLIRKDILERRVFEESRNFCLNGEMLKHAAKQVYQYVKNQQASNAETRELKRTIADCEKRIANIQNALEQGIIDIGLNDRIKVLTETKRNAEQELARYTSSSEVKLSDIEKVLNEFAHKAVSAGENSFRMILNSFVHSVDVKGDKIIITFNIFKSDKQKETPADLESVEVSGVPMLVTHTASYTNLYNGMLCLVISLNET